MVITPPQLHKHVEVLVSAGAPLIMVIGAPGTQGDDVIGMQGMGVSTPIAAAVAEATIGFVGVMHIPKGGMFTMGRCALIFAASGPPAFVGIPIGMTAKVLGAIP